MTRRITLELADEVLNRAERLATLARRDVTEVLVEAVTVALPPWDVLLGAVPPISDLSDQEVLKLADSRLEATLDQRLSRLLDRQQSGTLSDVERTELLALMQVYEASLLRQAEALAEAVRRRLRKPDRDDGSLEVDRSRLAPTGGRIAG